MSTKTVSNLLAPAGYPQCLAAVPPQCGDRTASLLCLGLSRFEPSNEQPQTSLLSLAFLPPFPPLRADWSALGQLCRFLAYVFLAPPSLPARNLDPFLNATPAGNERVTVVPLGYLRASMPFYMVRG